MSGESLRSWDEIEDRLRSALAPGLEVVRSVGGGASTAVFLAREPALQRLVALKVLRPSRARDAKARARFLREARSIARISHPNVISVYRIDELEGVIPYIVMQYVRGRSLAEHLRSSGSLPIGSARTVLLGVAAALQAAHERGILHRDLNPSNVLVEADTGQVYLTDFGLALLLRDEEGSAERITTQGHVVGNLRYLSPELVEGSPPTDRADMWGLGVLAWEVLAGRGPFDAGSIAATLRASAEGGPPELAVAAPGVTAEEADLFSRCLSVEPTARPVAAEAECILARQVRDPVSGSGAAAARIRTPGSAGTAHTFPTPPRGPDSTPVALRVLGSLDLEATGKRTPGAILSQPKRVALLVALACGADGGYQRRDTLIGLLWPEVSQHRGRHALRQSLYILRKTLGKDLLVSRGDDELGIDGDVMSCDVLEFTRAVNEERPQAAMEWYRGDLLPGFFLSDAVEFERWLERERFRLRGIAAGCCWTLAREEEQRGAVAAAAAWARRAAELLPFDEGSMHRLIGLLDRTGDRAGAIRAYDHFAARLSDEYAADPSPETVALIEQVRARA